MFNRIYKIKNIWITIIGIGIILPQLSLAKKVATKSNTTSVYSTVKNLCDGIVNEKRYEDKVSKLNGLVKQIKSKVMDLSTKSSASDKDPYLTAWQNADYEFDFLQRLFIDRKINEYLNCVTISDRLSDGLSNDLKKDLQPYIELAKRVSKNLCAAQNQIAPDQSSP